MWYSLSSWNINNDKGENRLSIEISCNFDEENLQLGVDEEYNLVSSISDIKINANTTIGILRYEENGLLTVCRALETLSQLGMYKKSLGLLAIPLVSIHGCICALNFSDVQIRQNTLGEVFLLIFPAIFFLKMN